MVSLLRRAIAELRLIECMYDGHIRVGEPHVCGVKDGKEQVLIFQVRGGSSSGGLPQWRRLEMIDVGALRLLEERFAGPRATKSGRHTHWDEVYAMVE